MSLFKKRRGLLSLIILIVSLKFAQNNYLQHNSSSCFSRCQYIPETLIQKSNMRIIGNNMRIK